MTGSTLIAHGAIEMTYEELKKLPTPEPMGRWHRPIPHALWRDEVKAAAERRGLHLVKERHAVQRTHILYSTFDFEADPNAEIVSLPEGRLHSLGTRGSNDQTIPREAGVGQRVVVCSNGLFDGTLISLKHKQTTGFNIRAELDEMFDRYVVQAQSLEDQVLRAQERKLTAAQAKALIYDAFLKHEVMPLRMMRAVNRDYFDPQVTEDDPATDLVGHPGTLWHLHSAFTRAARDLKPARRFEATAKLGGLLALGSRN